VCFWHGRDIGGVVGPCAYAVDGLDHAKMGYMAGATSEKIFARRVARSWGVR